MEANKEKEIFSTFEEYKNKFYPKTKSKAQSKASKHYELGVSLAKESLDKLRDVKQK